MNRYFLWREWFSMKIKPECLEETRDFLGKMFMCGADQYLSHCVCFGFFLISIILVSMFSYQITQ
jgi:hypothetical protein